MIKVDEVVKEYEEIVRDKNQKVPTRAPEELREPAPSICSYDSFHLFSQKANSPRRLTSYLTHLT